MALAYRPEVGFPAKKIAWNTRWPPASANSRRCSARRWRSPSPPSGSAFRRQCCWSRRVSSRERSGTCSRPSRSGRRCSSFFFHRSSSRLPGGSIFVACLIGGVLSLSGALPLASALLFGAIVSATDPVAVVAVFRTVAVPTALRTIVEAESISNDGIAVVLYSIAVALATGVSVSWAGASIGGIVAIAGGVAIGAACAVPLWLALWTIDSSEYEVTATLTLAYAAYVIADSLHCSGIFATAAAAISLRALLAQRAHLGYRDQVDGFWNAAAYMANAIVFLATGLLIDPGRVLHEPLLIVVGLAVVLGSRAVLAVLIASSLRDRATVFLAGMRGGLTMALALALPESVRDRAPIIDAVFATVLVTLVAQGVPLRASVERLYGRRAGSGVQPG